MKLTMTSGRIYHPVQLVSITSDSMQIWVNSGSATISRKDIASIEVFPPDYRFLSTIGGLVTGLLLSAKAAGTDGLEGAIAPLEIAAGGIVGTLYGAIIGIILSKSTKYDFNNMTEKEESLLIKKLFDKFGVVSTEVKP